MKKKFHNKQLHNYTKENKNKNFPNKVGARTPLLDKNNNVICIGDKVLFSRPVKGSYMGYIFYDHKAKSYVLAFGYYTSTIFSLKNFGKTIYIPLDNGAKAHLTIIEPV